MYANMYCTEETSESKISIYKCLLGCTLDGMHYTDYTLHSHYKLFFYQAIVL